MPVDVAPRDTATVAAAVRAPEPAATPAPRPTAVTQLIADALRAEGSISKPTLVRRLGPPRRATVEPVPNRFEIGRTDTVRTLLYRGLEAMLYEATQPPRTFLIRLVLTSPRYRSPEGLHVGMGRTQILDRIGPPTNWDTETGELIYAENETMPTALILTVREGYVTQIAWEFYFS